MLREQFCHDFAADVRQAEIAAEVAICQPLVIESKAVENRGLQVVNVDAISCDFQAEVVRFADHLAAFDSAAGQP